MDTIELKDFLDFTYLSDVALSPDGSRPPICAIGATPKRTDTQPSCG